MDGTKCHSVGTLTWFQATAQQAENGKNWNSQSKFHCKVCSNCYRNSTQCIVRTIQQCHHHQPDM